MERPVRVLGINAAHDAAACLLVDGELAVAIGEERLTRRKHHEGFPYQAVQYCLDTTALTDLNDVDAIVVNEYEQTDFVLELRQRGYAGTVIGNPSHHLLHAYYAWIASGFTETAILVVDGAGYSYGEYVRQNSPFIGEPPPFTEMEEAESLYSVTEGKLELVRKRWSLWQASRPFYRFASLGHMFSMASQYIFGHWQHAGKTMGLAPYGDAAALPEPLLELTPDGMEIATDWVTQLPPRSALPADQDPVCRNLAAKVQAELERAMLHLCQVLHERTGHTRLCLSGGVGLNSVTNGRIHRESPFTEVFITPAAGDAGVAIGAALYGHHQLTGSVPAWHYPNDYHGREYSRSEVDDAWARRSSLLRATEAADLARAAAADLADGRVIGWFEGGAEFGPRSLGHRSILCDPRPAHMRDHLNEEVKYREAFRPYAASVLSEHIGEFFDLAVQDPFMLVVADVVAEQRDRIPSVCHVDATCRIQSVGSGHPGLFRQVIERFHTLTGVPMVLNTSFNVRGEPIVETPADAMDCFLACNIDVLYLGGYRFTKARLDSAEEPDQLVPYLTNALSIVTTVPTTGGAAQPAQFFVQSRTGYRAPTTAHRARLLSAVDGRMSVADLANRFREQEPALDVRAELGALQRQGFVCFRFPIDRIPAA